MNSWYKRPRSTELMVALTDAQINFIRNLCLEVIGGEKGWAYYMANSIDARLEKAVPVTDETASLLDVPQSRLRRKTKSTKFV